MKLEELFISPPVHEDYGRPTEPPSNVPEFNPRFSKIIGTFDGREIWGSRELRGMQIFGIKEDEKVVAYTIIEDTETNGAFRLREIWVNPEYRGQAYAACILLFIIRKMDMQLLVAHNEPVSDLARSFILKMFEKSKFKISSEDGKMLNIDDVRKMFKSLGKTEDSFIIHETKVPFEMFGDVDGTLKEPHYVRFEKEID